MRTVRRLVDPTVEGRALGSPGLEPAAAYIAEQIQKAGLEPGGSRAGIPGVQIFSGAHADFHHPADTADKIDARGLVRVAAPTRKAIAYLVSHEGRLTATGYNGGAFFSRDGQWIIWRAARPTGDALADYQALLAKGLESVKKQRPDYPGAAGQLKPALHNADVGVRG